MGSVSCLIAEDGHVCEADKIGNERCLKYEFDLEGRNLAEVSETGPFPFVPRANHEMAAVHFFDQRVSTAERLMEFAREGRIEKMNLVELLRPEKRQTYLDLCGIIEKACVDVCAARGEPCLEDGCATKGETCLQACLAAGKAYQEA